MLRFSTLLVVSDRKLDLAETLVDLGTKVKKFPLLFKMIRKKNKQGKTGIVT